ncbi:hypothetical protein [uncultured Sphingobacterium sp.]|uniref:hypothetical protein n=1 Tax=uncultured Sphingobacterium sp. TaxID=182688 RepID=UPI0025CD555F|nr:hypothetical protein [uncultured Sphingobacterium sp.]
MKNVSFKSIKTGCVMLAVSLTFLNCGKDSDHLKISPEKPTLKEFLARIPLDQQDLIKGKPIDNTNYLSKLKLRAGPVVTTPADPVLPIDDFRIRLKVSFKWHGTGGASGCNSTLGICAILSFNEVELDPGPVIGDDFNSVAAIIGDKLVIKPISIENGLTSDGYLPVGDFVAINDQYMIKPGLYVGTPEQIIVDLVPIL